jgi:hypothetical protein
VEVFTAFCESHASQVPFYAVARLLRAATGVEGLDEQTARDRVRAWVPDTDPEDLVLFDDVLEIADPEVPLPKIDPDARRRRLTALVNAASLARQAPAVYVVEDAHWIDEVSESMIADFLTVIPQTPSLVMITYRPEYRGRLTRVADAQTIALAPLRDSETVALIGELLGPDPSVGGLGKTIAERAAGNPFFAEEIVRELAERGVLHGERGGYVSTVGAAEVSVPATVQAAIAARIDRLDPAAKRTLVAAAVIGSKFSRDLLQPLGIDPVLDDLVGGELIDQITLTGEPEYVFHHPLIRMVAYESQLKSDRAQMHRRLAAAIESRDPAAADENAALIAEHLETAGDLRAAYGWHMRAGAWLSTRETPPTASIGIAIAPWRHRLASRATSPGPRRCHDDGRGAASDGWDTACRSGCLPTCSTPTDGRCPRPAGRTPHAGQEAQKVTTGTNQLQNGIGPPPKDEPMTDTPDDLPSPDEYLRKMAHVDQEFADARRYLSALCAEDNQALGALMVEIHRSGRAMKVLAAMAVQALDFAHLSADRLGGDVQKWLDESVMAQDTAETERDQTELGGEG